MKAIGQIIVTSYIVILVQADEEDGGGVNGDIVELTLLMIDGGTMGRGEDPAKGEAAPLNAGRPGEVALPEFIAA